MRMRFLRTVPCVEKSVPRLYFGARENGNAGPDDHRPPGTTTPQLHQI